MKTIRTHKQMIFCFLPGFLLGILYVNLVFQQYGGMKAFYVSDFLVQYYHSNTKRIEYFIYVLRVRVVEFGVLAGIMVTRIKRQMSYLILLWTGFLFGIMMSVAVISMGIKGCIFCVVGLVPQILFYLPVYVILISYGITAPYSNWNKLKTEFVIGTVLTGILVEVHVNPFLLNLWIKL